MTKIYLSLFILLAALTVTVAAADNATVVPLAPSKAAPGWMRQANSLLLYDDTGALTHEIPLAAPEDFGNSSRETIGGVSPDGSLAWTLERRLIWNPGRTKLLETQRNFKLFGSTSHELWHDVSVDIPERGSPVVFSNDGKTLVLSQQLGDGWVAQARGYLGQTIVSVGPLARLISIAISPNGRFILVRWAVPDKSDTHTFVDLKSKVRKEVPSSDLVLGLARIGDDGVVRSGSRQIYAFDLNVTSTTLNTTISSTTTHQ